MAQQKCSMNLQHLYTFLRITDSWNYDIQEKHFELYKDFNKTIVHCVFKHSITLKNKFAGFNV